jgi:hypothetical protein
LSKSIRAAAALRIADRSNGCLAARYPKRTGVCFSPSSSRAVSTLVIMVSAWNTREAVFVQWHPCATEAPPSSP